MCSSENMKYGKFLIWNGNFFSLVEVYGRLEKPGNFAPLSLR